MLYFIFIADYVYMQVYLHNNLYLATFRTLQEALGFTYQVLCAIAQCCNAASLSMLNEIYTIMLRYVTWSYVM